MEKEGKNESNWGFYLILQNSASGIWNKGVERKFFTHYYAMLMVVEHGIPIPQLYIHVCYIVPSCPLIGKSDVGSLRYSTAFSMAHYVSRLMHVCWKQRRFPFYAVFLYNVE